MPTPVILSFDTEDFISPLADDALLRVARLLQSKGIRGSFCFVGENARALQERGRQDVIDAMKHHEIGFHSRDHSIHPTIAPRCEKLGWERGLVDLRQQELPAIAWTKEILGRDRLLAAVPPGSNTTPQAIWLYGQAGIPVYAGGFFGHSDGTMYWYLGTLNVPYTFYADAACASHEAQGVYDRFAAQAGRPVAVVCVHPTILVHREFWDGVNFPAGTNRPREQWQPAPMRPLDEIETIFARYSALLDLIAADDRFEFYDYERLLSEARPRAECQQRAAVWPAEAFAHLVDGPDWVSVPGEGCLSPQEAFGELAVRATGEPAWRERLAPRLLPGPVEPPQLYDADLAATGEQVLRCLWETQGQIGAEKLGLPACWTLNDHLVGPGKLLSALAQIALGHQQVRIPARLPELPASIIRQVGLDTWSYGSWLYEPGFDGRKTLELSRQMAWTLAQV
jgi:peptidoglycan/xylan/chitin deacetylase (PgdA/CDA1 family)